MVGILVENELVVTHGLVEVYLLGGSEENHEKHQSEYPVSWPRWKPCLQRYRGHRHN
jgi:hypothetical protein